MRSRVAAFMGFLVLAALVALEPKTEWIEAFLGWSLTNLAEQWIPGYAESRAQ